MYDIKKQKNSYELFINNKFYKEYELTEKDKVLTDLVVIVNHLFSTRLKENEFVLSNIAIIKDQYKLFDKNKIKLIINNKEFKVKFYFFKRINKFIICKYKIFIPYKKTLDFDVRNKLLFVGENKQGYGFKKALHYHFYDKNKGRYKLSKLKFLKDEDTALYIRQNSTNRIDLTNRQINITDSKKEQIKINKAWLCSKFLFKNPILLYEKNASRYQESASVLYENLIDKGYKNVYYILDSNNFNKLNIDKKYKKNIIIKNTFKHYLYFFSSKTYLGTEAVAHAIELRVASRIANKKIYANKYQYVFLQHGVMYMVSLDAGGRNFVRKGNLMPKKTKIVTSSELEAQHFIDLGGYDKEDLYICGLPKFDRNYREKKHEKIIIMPTWRPWEFNSIRENPYETTYYKFIKNIIDQIPKKLLKNVIILPHPLFVDALKETKLKEYMLEDAVYDEVLRETDTLITDYSSIAYDAFYRGTNIIFCWTDKDECMEKYEGHLMLNEKNVFGDTCYEYSDIKKMLLNNYNKKQSEKYLKRYNKIVEFHDGNNTNRLIEFMKKDKII